MTILKLILWLGLFGILSGCFTVKAVNQPEDESCHLVTKALAMNFSGDLSSSYLQSSADVNQNSDSSKAVLVLLVAIPVTSFIVSGSISVLGNAVHWVEKQGRCEDSEIRTFTSAVNDSIVSAGGMMLDTSADFLDWMQGK